MTINLKIPNRPILKPSITVFGTGGAGGNAVNNMIATNLEGINFVVANTDAQAMENSLAQHRIQLGATITQGLGAGSYPEVGRASAEEAQSEILDAIKGSNMLFITAGMGGGTGTGAAPVVARLAHEQGILTVAVVTKPFHFEGTHRMRVAEAGLNELQKHVDTLIVIPNQNLFRVVDKNTTFADAFKMADNVLMAGVRGVTDLMMMPGLINLDFADVRSVMSEMGRAMMGTGEATGDNRASQAAEAAISNPLLDNASMKGARGVLINITGGSDMTLFEVDEAANRIRDEVDPEANIIFGSTFSPELEGKIRVSVVATGIEQEQPARAGISASSQASTPAYRTMTAAQLPPAPAANPYANRPTESVGTVTVSATTTQKPAANPYASRPAEPAQTQASAASKPIASVVDPSYFGATTAKEQPATQPETAKAAAAVAETMFKNDADKSAPWFRQQGKQEATDAQANGMHKQAAAQKPKSLFSRVAALAGFQEEEPLYRPASSSVHVSSNYGQPAPQQESPSFGTASQLRAPGEQPSQQGQQQNFGDDLLDTPAYLRRRAK